MSGANPKVRDDDRRGGGAPGVLGNPAFEVRDGERDRVKEYGRFLTNRQIGLLLRGPGEVIDGATIGRHFGDELAWARAHLIGEIGGKMIEAALAGNVHSGMQFLKWFGDPGQFVDSLRLTGPGGGPIQTADLAALAGLDLEKLKDLERAATIIAGIFGDDAAGPATVPDAAGPAASGDSPPGT